jgi:hypothetical protein
MKTMMQKLACTTLFAAAVLATGQQQSAAPELRVLDMKAKQPKEVIAASSPCRRAWESPDHDLREKIAIDPRSLARNLGELIGKSDEVVLAAETYRDDALVAPSGQSVANYYEVYVLRSWKGSHNVGDIMTFGVPVGTVHCGELESHESVSFSTMIGTSEFKNGGHNGPFVLFLRKAQGGDAQLVQGLLPAGGAGLQGIFTLELPVISEEEDRCGGVLPGEVEWCDAFLETSQNPIIVPYVHDPLAKQYDGMPMSEFLHEVRAVASEQGLYEKSTTSK